MTAAKTALAPWIVLCASLAAIPAFGEASAHAELPRVLMIEAAPDDPGLYKAVRAQLSAAPLILNRIGIHDKESLTTAPLENASRLANDHRASMVFWIEDDHTCRLLFYIPDPDGGRINSRVLKLDIHSRSTRHEVIAIAVASMVEGLLVSRRLKPVSAPQAGKPPAPKSAPVAKAKARQRTWFEILAAYSGSLFTADSVTHGARLGFGLMPLEQLVIGASFTHNFPSHLESRLVRLSIFSRTVEASLAGRLALRQWDLRIGLAWSIDLRSFSASPRRETIDPRPDGFKTINALSPFVSAAWLFKGRLGLFARVGASIALDETVYKVKMLDGYEETASPFLVKLSYQFGLSIQI